MPASRTQSCMMRRSCARMRFDRVAQVIAERVEQFRRQLELHDLGGQLLARLHGGLVGRAVRLDGRQDLLLVAEDRLQAPVGLDRIRAEILARWPRRPRRPRPRPRLPPGLLAGSTSSG